MLHFDIGEACFGEMRFESGERFGGGHVRNQAHVEFRDGALPGRMVLPPGPV